MVQMELEMLRTCYYENWEYEFEVKEFVNVGDRPAFVAMMKYLYPRDTYCPPHVFELVCICGAVDCTKALLEGDPFIVDLNVPFQSGLYPLHIAAENFLYDMVDLLLCHGASTDVRTLDGEFCGDLLPLNIALEMLSFHRYLYDWTPKQSIFKLIVILSLPQMKVPLETNRLLAWNTKDVNNIFNHYAMEGKLIPMAALLMVAREKIMAPSMLQSKDSGLEEGMMIRQWIREEIASLTDAEVELMCSGKNCNQRLKNKKAVMTIALLLLEVFGRAGDAIQTYRQSVRYHMSKEKVVKDIKALLEESGFVLKDKDIDLSDIDCENEDIKLATEVLEKRTSFRPQLQDLCMPVHSVSGSFCQAKNPITYKFNEQRWAMYNFLPLGSPVLSRARPDYIFPLTDDFVFDLPHVRFSPMNFSGAMIGSVAYYLYEKRFRIFALAIKRGCTCI